MNRTSVLGDGTARPTRNDEMYLVTCSPVSVAPFPECCAYSPGRWSMEIGQLNDSQRLSKKSAYGMGSAPAATAMAMTFRVASTSRRSFSSSGWMASRRSSPRDRAAHPPEPTTHAPRRLSLESGR